MSSVPYYGKEVWDKLNPSEDISLSASFAGRESTNAAELQAQWGSSGVFPPTLGQLETTLVDANRSKEFAAVLRAL
jgi:hypothetical protein